MDAKMVQLCKMKQFNQRKCQIVEQSASIDERLLAAFEEIESLREQVEYLNEVIESQKSYQPYQDRELQKLEQELKVTNDDLCNALSVERLVPPTLEGEKSTSEFLAELLTAIYNSTVESKELKGNCWTNLIAIIN